MKNHEHELPKVTFWLWGRPRYVSSFHNAKMEGKPSYTCYMLHDPLGYVVSNGHLLVTNNGQRLLLRYQVSFICTSDPTAMCEGTALEGR